LQSSLINAIEERDADAGAEAEFFHGQEQMQEQRLGPKDRISVAQEAWTSIDHQQLASRAFKVTGPAMPLTGPVDWGEFSRDFLQVIRAFDADQESFGTGMLRLRDKAVAEVKAGYDAGSWTQWADWHRLVGGAPQELYYGLIEAERHADAESEETNREGGRTHQGRVSPTFLEQALSTCGRSPRSCEQALSSPLNPEITLRPRMQTQEATCDTTFQIQGWPDEFRLRAFVPELRMTRIIEKIEVTPEWLADTSCEHRMESVDLSLPWVEMDWPFACNSRARCCKCSR